MHAKLNGAAFVPSAARSKGPTCRFGRGSPSRHAKRCCAKLITLVVAAGGAEHYSLLRPQEL
ncbi:MAG: hypothetical protein ACTS43_01110 [Candidatus Hodgkinia cicadicola]